MKKVSQCLILEFVFIGLICILLDNLERAEKAAAAAAAAAVAAASSHKVCY